MPTATIARKKIAQPGTIKAHGFDNIPDDYLLCDGSIVSREQYPDLFNAIGTSWGYGNNDGLTFHLPDLRGKFLRGVAFGTGNTVDRNATSRTTNNAGGNTGNNVGTDQNDKTRRPRDANMRINTRGTHSHNMQVARGNATNGNDRAWEPYQTGENNEVLPVIRNGGHNHSISSGGDLESRPINSSVVFVIKI